MKDGDLPPVTGPVTVKDANAPTRAEVMETVGHTKIAINFVGGLLTGVLGMFLQAGGAMVETGFPRATTAAHTLSMTFMFYEYEIRFL